MAITFTTGKHPTYGTYLGKDNYGSYYLNKENERIYVYKSGTDSAKAGTAVKVGDEQRFKAGLNDPTTILEEEGKQYLDPSPVSPNDTPVSPAEQPAVDSVVPPVAAEAAAPAAEEAASDVTATDGSAVALNAFTGFKIPETSLEKAKAVIDPIDPKAKRQRDNFLQKAVLPAIGFEGLGLTIEALTRYGRGSSDEIAKQEIERIEREQEQIGLVGREEERDIKASAGRAGAALQQEIEQTAAATGRLDPRQIQAAAEQAKKIEEEGVVKGKAVRAAMQTQEEQQLEDAKRSFQATRIRNNESMAKSINKSIQGIAGLYGRYAGSTIDEKKTSISRVAVGNLLKKYDVPEETINNIGYLSEEGFVNLAVQSKNPATAKEEQELRRQFLQEFRSLQ